jgi:hypothetical protein
LQPIITAEHGVRIQKGRGGKMKRKLITLIGTLLIGFLLVTAQVIAEMPADVLAQIKAKAAKDFPDDYNTQKYVIQTQEQAYSHVQNYRDSQVPQTVLSELKQKAASGFPLDFSTQKYVLDTQCSAYVQVKNYSAQGVPSDALEKIMHKAERDFPNDYSTV